MKAEEHLLQKEQTKLKNKLNDKEGAQAVILEKATELVQSYLHDNFGDATAQFKLRRTGGPHLLGDRDQNVSETSFMLSPDNPNASLDFVLKVFLGMKNGKKVGKVLAFSPATFLPLTTLGVAQRIDLARTQEKA